MTAFRDDEDLLVQHAATGNEMKQGFRRLFGYPLRGSVAMTDLLIHSWDESHCSNAAESVLWLYLTSIFQLPYLACRSIDSLCIYPLLVA